MLDARGKPTGRKNLAWFGGRRTEMSPGGLGRRHPPAPWACTSPTTTRTGPHDDAYLIWFHGGAEPIQVELPDGPWAHTYTVVAHTGGDGELPTEKISAGSALQLPGRTVVGLQVD